MEIRKIEKDFVDHTLHILDHYDGPYGVTLLVNCLLGLIVFPRERGYRQITDTRCLDFDDLGIKERNVLSWGKIPRRDKNVARFLRCMRNAVAHIQIESISGDGEIQSLYFSDESGFEAVFDIETVKTMVRKLAECIQCDRPEQREESD
jgi:hypothetical protein